MLEHEKQLSNETTNREGRPAVIPQEIPLLYFNGFVLQYGSADFTLKVKVDGQDMAVLKMSYTVGKSLAEKLGKLVGDFERITDHNVMTSTEVATYMKRENDRGTQSA